MREVLFLAEDFQACIDREEFFAIDQVIEKYRHPTGAEIEKEGRYARRKQEFSVFRKLERLRSEWGTCFRMPGRISMKTGRSIISGSVRGI